MKCKSLLDATPNEQLMAEIERIKPEMEKRVRRMYDVPHVENALAFADQLKAAMKKK